jgi:gliding motility-associated-like protein
VPRGPNTAYVKDALNCGVGQKPFLILNLINVITPNGDGINDVLDYSDIKIKENVSIMIFSRNGTRVFQSANDNYLWDGKLDGRALPTGTYWYVLTWTEPVSTTSATFTGWVLLKNRN